LLFAFTKILGPIPFDITQVTTSKTDVFTVTGEGKVQAKPDSAKVSLGVLAKESTSELAQDQLNKNINKVIESIKKLGVPEIDIKTENYNIYPDYGEISPMLIGTGQTGQDNITGYTANTNITVTVDSAEIANQVIDAGTSSGANQIGGVDFQVKDKNEALNKARELAVADAKIKAEDAARIAGFKLGKVINYSESEGGDYPFAMMSKTEGSLGSGVPTQVQPGTNEIAVTGSLSYEIR
jgi:uncharacterized protein YggE